MKIEIEYRPTKPDATRNAAEEADFTVRADSEGAMKYGYIAEYMNILRQQTNSNNSKKGTLVLIIEDTK